MTDAPRPQLGKIRLHFVPQYVRLHVQELRLHAWCVPSHTMRMPALGSDLAMHAGWVLTCVATGMEASAHMAEDTKRPARTVPLAMFWSVAATYGMGWVSICVLLAVRASRTRCTWLVCLLAHPQTMHLDGSDPELQPSIALIANSIPRKYTTLILVLVLLSFLFQNIAQLLATSRFIWALARESALPFSKFFRRLSSKTRQPTVAIWATWAISFPALLLIAVNVSIIATTLLEGAGITCTSSYVAPLLFYLACWGDDVLRGDGRAKWTLRGASKFLAIPPALFLLVFITMMCLPTGYPVTPRAPRSLVAFTRGHSTDSHRVRLVLSAVNMSYASVMLVGVLLVSTLAWVLYGNGAFCQRALPGKSIAMLTRLARLCRPLRGPDQDDHALDDRRRSGPSVLLFARHEEAHLAQEAFGRCCRRRSGAHALFGQRRRLGLARRGYDDERAARCERARVGDERRRGESRVDVREQRGRRGAERRAPRCWGADDGRGGGRHDRGADDGDGERVERVDGGGRRGQRRGRRRRRGGGQRGG